MAAREERVRATRCTREQECDCTCRGGSSRKIRWCRCRCRRAPLAILDTFSRLARDALRLCDTYILPFPPSRPRFDPEDGLRNTTRRTFEPSDRMKKKRPSSRGGRPLLISSSSDPKCIEPITEFVVTNERWMWRNTPAGNRTKCW